MRRKLTWEISELEKAQRELVSPSSPDAFAALHRPMYIAANAATTAWHMVDWLGFHIQQQDWWDRISDISSTPIRTQQSLEQWAKTNEDMRLCYAIALALKHVALRNKELETTRIEVRGWYAFYDCGEPPHQNAERKFRMNIDISVPIGTDTVERDATEVLSGSLRWWYELLAHFPPEEDWIPWAG
ncbi:hypothetical protein M0D44_19825 [Xanthomonas prunicola]|uniref:hypothetical protein n=1 Tax=Xanthomonas prunicola TaxID=2053930 RepID=UPI0021B1B59D|nr:hypothetical protein [Xanthomonas prunicola]UXA48493.1 hypothetical protein M0D44_19825 [Xanthomonas prunicola]